MHAHDEALCAAAALPTALSMLSSASAHFSEKRHATELGLAIVQAYKTHASGCLYIYGSQLVCSWFLAALLTPVHR